MPGMDNSVHVRRLRAQFANAVIIGLSKEDRGVPYLQAGMNDFLQRPFPPYRLAMMMDGGDILN
jgi:DNA-binding response OmpR family regulator